MSGYRADAAHRYQCLDCRSDRQLTQVGYTRESFSRAWRQLGITLPNRPSETVGTVEPSAPQGVTR